MHDVTGILLAMREGGTHAGDRLMQAVYEELRRMAALKMAREQPDHTLNATALVHEAWLRLGDRPFVNRSHFFSAAAEAMRRILVDSARRSSCGKRGGRAVHLELSGLEVSAAPAVNEELLAVHEALDGLAQLDPRKAELVKLRYFAGLSFGEAAEILNISLVTAKRDWTFARAWLHSAITAR